MSKFELPTATPSSASALSTPAEPRQSTSSYNNSDDDDDDDLPYPTELPRSDFLSPNFDASTYLSTVARNRHQTLEDLRSDLRQRSQLLNKELVELVNGNYEEFLSLGSDLRDGEEKVEGVRVGVLGFEREVNGIKAVVNERKEEVRGLLEEKKEIRREVALGRALIEVSERLGEVERDLGITVEGDEVDDEVDDEAEDERHVVEGLELGKLRRFTMQYLLIGKMVERIGAEHPFLVKQRGRMEEIRKTILLDLAASLRQARNEKKSQAALALMKIYADLDAEAESVKVLKGG
ncbi:uncharacterized protein MYCFIDRAFT_215654 [Pseudocercospora fijiensis CIRAD86]|uniref:Conserved oligomeric Golgi complex subunit 2 n=1 Tax=Pseudocercospora fijiensis (strain CIRAD86) TaxID=383855 RepID=M3AYS3_PSEFD|nr:uncharacterized protein MYCFIDRAFT_215654 [Pseudocercospora fijiensis CIRAD86]EME82342.1 hypothetical protein MYCFIDRAFT_215654 [Pseudocercospora fijiensis CIRAD86]